MSRLKGKVALIIGAPKGIGTATRQRIGRGCGPGGETGSRDGGAHWADGRVGLPQSGAYFGVMRQALATDALNPAGVYFGTTGGQVYGSRDAGDSWAPIVRDLPAVLSVEVQTLS